MLLKPNEAVARLSNPLNLINRMRNGEVKKSVRSQAMSLFIRPSVEKINSIPTFTNPFEEKTDEKTPSIDELVKDSSKDISLATAHDEALGLLNDSIKIMRSKIDEIDADKLPSVINSSSKVVESIRRERSERDKNKKGQDVHYHFYTPEQRKVEEYEVIEVG